jgi:hypothetical protein
MPEDVPWALMQIRQSASTSVVTVAMTAEVQMDFSRLNFLQSKVFLPSLICFNMLYVPIDDVRKLFCLLNTCTASEMVPYEATHLCHDSKREGVCVSVSAVLMQVILNGFPFFLSLLTQPLSPPPTYLCIVLCS